MIPFTNPSKVNSKSSVFTNTSEAELVFGSGIAEISYFDMVEFPSKVGSSHETVASLSPVVTEKAVGE